MELTCKNCSDILPESALDSLGRCAECALGGTGFLTIPDEHRFQIAAAIEERYPEHAARIWEEGRWHGLSGYYGFTCNNMYLGCETDGHIHS